MQGSSTILYIFVSILLGVFSFALMGALNTWWKRNREEITHRDPLPLIYVLGRFLALTGGSVVVILAVRELLPYEIATAQGILKGERLFPMLAIDRYQGKLEVNTGIVEADQPLISYTRKLGPEEEAEAMLQRELLREQIAEANLRLTSGNPLNELRKLSQVESLRAARELKQQKRSREMWEIESLNFKLDEQSARVNLARKEMVFARDAIKSGLISQIEYDRRQQKQRMEEVRLKELKSRLEFAVGSTENSDQGNSRLDEVLDSDLTGVEATADDAELADLERRLREINRVLSDTPPPPIVVDAPWTGMIGYSNPSSVLAARDLIGVLIQPDSLSVEVLVPVSLTSDIEAGAKIQVTNEELSGLGVVLSGEVYRTQLANPNQTLLSLRIQPRADLVRDLALSKQVKLTVSFLNQPPVFFSELGGNLPEISPTYVPLILSLVILALAILVVNRRNRYRDTATKTEGA